MVQRSGCGPRRLFFTAFIFSRLFRRCADYQTSIRLVNIIASQRQRTIGRRAHRCLRSTPAPRSSPPHIEDNGLSDHQSLLHRTVTSQALPLPDGPRRAAARSHVLAAPRVAAPQARPPPTHELGCVLCGRRCRRNAPSETCLPTGRILGCAALCQSHPLASKEEGATQQ